jgi:hypothetical protein
MRLTPARLFARATAVPVAAAAAWLLVTFPLLVAGVFTPLAGALLGVPAVLAAAVLLPRLVPDLAEDDLPWWPLAATVLIAAAFAAVQLVYHGETLVIRRDPASYAQFTAWIAQNGSLPIPQQRPLIAGDDPALSYGSLAYYEVGRSVWPQFLAGAPLLFSVGHWIGGLDGMLLVPPIAGALGVFVFGGLAARLVGARWAPLAALLLAVCLPQQWASRATYSEPVAQVLMLGALLLAYDAFARRAGARGRWGAPHALAAAAGVAFGLGLVVRIDALRDLLPVVGFVGLLLLARRGQAVPLLGGLAVGLGYGFAAGFGLSKPYLDYLSASLDPLLAISAAVVVAVAAATALLWRRGVPRTDRPAWLPTAAAGLALLVVAALALRPLVYTHRGHGDEATAAYIGQVQGIEGLALDPDRTYDEMSLYWVGWYVGLSTVLFAGLGVALLVRRVLRRTDPQWALPLLLLVWTVATTLARPAITPDHPWASRRLVVLVLPAFVLIGVWFVAWLTRRLREGEGRAARGLAAAAAAFCAVVMTAPTAVTAAGVMDYRSDVGTVAATRSLCDAIPSDASVVIVDGLYHNYMQLVRGMCGVPTAAITAADPVADAVRVVDEIRARGRTPVVAASEPDRIERIVPPGTPVLHPFEVQSAQDPSTLMRPPSGAWAFHGDVWLAVVG